MLDHKLEHVDAWNERRREIAHEYRTRLADLPVAFQEGAAPDEHVYHPFELRTPRRDALLQHLRARGIDAVVRYPHPIHLQEAFARLGYTQGDFPVSEYLAATNLCLPLFPSMTAGQIDLVCDVVAGFFAGR